MHNWVSRWSGYFSGSAVLLVTLVTPTVAYAQEIPDSVIWSLGASLFAPIIAVPVKLGIARLFGAAVQPSKLWVLCAIEWLLWFPGGFIVFRLGGLGFGLFALLAISAWLHRSPTSAGPGFAKFAIGLVLAFPAPVLALLLFVTVLRV